MKSNNRYYAQIREYLDTIPVINTHEHYTGAIFPEEDALDFLTQEEYYNADFQSAAFGMEQELESFWSKENGHASFEERMTLFQNIYARSNMTAYARGQRAGLKACYGIDDVSDPESIRKLQYGLRYRNDEFHRTMTKKCRIKNVIADLTNHENFLDHVEGRITDCPEECRFAFRISAFHNIHSKEDILRLRLQHYTGGSITCLDDFTEGIEFLLKRCMDFGIVCLKDHSAYRRTLAYSNPSKHEAERIFHEIMVNPRTVYGDDEARPLDDWLFHFFMRLAAKYDLPVQIHTGHIASIRNEISKTNAVHFIPVLELHQDVRFDLLHGNWPYMGECLFIGKNYPNVWLNLCWVHWIDPIYAVDLMKRAIMTIPHSKIFAFGGDTNRIEWTVGFLSITKDNVACALSELVEMEWIGMEEARRIAREWFYDNPKEFYRL